MGFRFAIDRLVQACQQHPNRDQFWFSKQPCQSKFSSANGEQSTVKERLVIHFHNDHAHTGWITTCVDILDKGKVPKLFSVVQMRNLRIKHWAQASRWVSHVSVFWNATHRTHGQYIQSSSSWHYGSCNFHLETDAQLSIRRHDITWPACNGKHRPHTNKKGCKKFKGPAPELAHEPKTAKAVPKKNAKKPISPDTKLEVPSQPLHPDDEPMVASGPSSGSKDGVPRRREPQLEEETEIKPKPKVEVELEEKKEPSPKGTLSLALQRIHDKLQSPTELLKLHLKHSLMVQGLIFSILTSIQSGWKRLRYFVYYYGFFQQLLKKSISDWFFQ